MTRKRDLAGVHAALDALAEASVGDPKTMRDLLEAVLLVGRGLELDQALQRIVEVAAIGGERVGAGAALGAHHLQEGFDERATVHAGQSEGFRRSTGMRSVISPLFGFT